MSYTVIRDINEYLSFITFGVICYSFVVAIGRHRMMKRFLFLALYPLNGAYASYQGERLQAPTSSAIITLFVINILVLAVCLTVIVQKPEKVNHVRSSE